jgi:hypothetical protein
MIPDAIRQRLHAANLAVLHLSSADRPDELAQARLELEDAKAAFDACVREIEP